MKEILTQLLFAVLTICAPLATAYVRKAAAAINASAAEKIKNETIQRICCEITDAVADAVAAMNQTYVNDLKKTGSFDKAAQAKALNGAISAAIKSLSSDALDYIKGISGGDRGLSDHAHPGPDRPQQDGQGCAAVTPHTNHT